MNIEKRNQIISIVLATVAIGLSYVLYVSITEPYQEVIEREKVTAEVRGRMLAIKDVLIQYELRNRKFPPAEGGLDSIIAFVKTDSLVSSMADSMFSNINPFVAEQIVYSPRNPDMKFIYTVNDTLRPPIYLLEDPTTKDAIGSLERTTLRNSPNWN